MSAKRMVLIGVLVFSVLGFTVEASADGFELTGISFTLLNVPGASSVPGTNSTVAAAINDTGEIVGYYDTGTNYDGFVDVGGAFSTLNFPGGHTLLFGVNNAGQIVGDSLAGGFLYSGGTISATTGPGGIGLEPRGINNSGQIVGDFSDSTGEHGFLLSGNSFSSLTFPGAVTTLALGVNDSGQVVGSYTNQNGEFGFLYSGGTYSTILCPGSLSGDALGINDGGQVVGDCSLAGQVNGFLYANGAYTFVDVPFHATNEAIGINNNSQIVGFTGAAVPEPNTLVLLTFGLVGITAAGFATSHTRRFAKV